MFLYAKEMSTIYRALGKFAKASKYDGPKVIL